MKKIIENALIEAWKKSQNVSTVVAVEKHEDITGMQLFELTDFIESNNIPLDAVFCSDDYSNSSLLYWSVDRDATVGEIEERRIYRFNNVEAFPAVVRELLELGYKRKSLDFIAYKKFGCHDLYEMYSNANYDKLEQYFLLHFIKE